MARPSVRAFVRGLAHKAREHLPFGPEPVGTRMRPEYDAVLQEFELTAHQALELTGGALVQSWEVVLAEISFQLGKVVPPEEVPKLAERWSDALVPFDHPFQQIRRSSRRTLQRGREQALATGELVHAFTGLVEAIERLPAELADGWERTGNHLQPLFSRLSDPAEAQRRFLARGPSLRVELEAVTVRFREDIQRVSAAASLSRALFEAIDRFKDDFSRALEFAISDQRVLFEQAVEQARR